MSKIFVSDNPDGLEYINDNVPADNRTYSSNKIEALGNLKTNITDIIDNVMSTDVDKPLSANQGKILKDMIDLINALLLSDNPSLDTLQELIDMIELNRADIDALGITNITGLQAVLDNKEPIILTKGSAFNKNFGTGNTDVMRGDVDVSKVGTITVDETNIGNEKILVKKASGLLEYEDKPSSGISAIISNDNTISHNYGDHFVAPSGNTYVFSSNYNGDGDAGWVKIGVVANYMAGQMEVAGDDTSVYFLKTDGTVWSVGYNNNYQLGDGTTNNRSEIGKVEGVENCIAISHNTNSVLFLLSDGSVKGLGYNYYNHLGQSSTATVKTPTLIPGISGCIKIQNAGNASLFLLSDGSVKVAGYNGFGQLGTGDKDNVSSGVISNLITGCKDISLGGYHTAFIMDDDTVKMCGYNSQYNFGNGTDTDEITPIIQSQWEGATQIDCEGMHTIAIMSDGSIKAGGQNDYGELGDGTTTDIQSATTTFTGPVKYIDAGNTHTTVVKTDGTIYSTGRNSFGQLGLGDTANRSSFTELSGINNVNKVHCYSNLLVLFDDGSVKVAGHNNYGQLGDGTISNQTSLVSTIGLHKTAVDISKPDFLL